MKVVDWIKSRREKRVPAGSAKAEYDKLEQTSPQLFDEYVSENFDLGLTSWPARRWASLKRTECSCTRP